MKTKLPSPRPRGGNWRPALFLTALVGLAPLRAAADVPALTPVADPRPILTELHQKMAPLQSLYLEFTQERHLKLFAAPLQSEGVMLMDQPGQIRWETTAPYQSILLGDRKSVAQFEFSEGKWTKLKLGFSQMLKGVMDQMTQMHQGKLASLTNDYTLTVSTGAVTVVRLVPNDEQVRSVLAALEIHLLPDLSTTREVVMQEPGGDFTRIIFTREKRNVKFPDRTFDQSQPTALPAIKTAVNGP